MAIPTDCTGLVSAAYNSANFAAVPLNDPILLDPSEVGAVDPVTPPADATTKQTVESATELRCLWRDPAMDLTGLLVTVAHVGPEVTTPYLAELVTAGYTCGDVSDGRQCQLITEDAWYPANDAQTVFVRDGIVVSVVEGNYRGDNGLVADISATLWP